MFSNLRKWFVVPFEQGETGTIIGILSFGLALITFIIWLITLIPNKPKLTIKYDQDQSFISTIFSNQPLKHNKTCIGYVSLKILGLSDKASSIKDVRLCARVNGKWREATRVSVKLTPMKQYNALTIRTFFPQANKYLYAAVEWDDIRNTFDKRIDYGAVEIGSGLFMFSESYSEIKSATKLMFIVIDNFDREYRVRLENDLNDVENGITRVMDFTLQDSKKYE